MKISKISIRNLFGIKEMSLGSDSVEISGTNGAGKTSIIDAIRYALTNESERDYLIHKGETEGEIIIETDTGLLIDRKKRENKADYKSVKEGNNVISSPESFLKTIFTPLQINPVAFIGMTKKEQNRLILDLIDFDWDLNWIKEQFGEIPDNVNYDQNILQVLNDIQAENGTYFMNRQDVNRDVRNKKAFIEDIAKDIPANYQADLWQNYNLAEKYQQLTDFNTVNNRISRAKMFTESYKNKIRGFEADKEIAISNHEKTIAAEKNNLTSKIERLKAEIKAAEDTLLTLGDKLEDKKRIEDEVYKTKVAQLDKDMGVAMEYTEKEPVDTAPLAEEIKQAESMIKHLNEYNRMKTMQNELESLIRTADDYTEKIELARNLPGEILKTATIPVEGLTVENGIPLIHNLPVSNLSEGEKLDLCIDVALCKPNSLQIILIDGAEKLSDENRSRLYKKCKEKGLQFIATRTTNDNELMVTTL